jgi:hypothetical protein
MVGGQTIIIKTKNQCNRTVNFVSSAGNCLALPAGGQMGQLFHEMYILSIQRENAVLQCASQLKSGPAVVKTCNL